MAGPADEIIQMSLVRANCRLSHSDRYIPFIHVLKRYLVSLCECPSNITDSQVQVQRVLLSKTPVLI